LPRRLRRAARHRGPRLLAARSGPRAGQRAAGRHPPPVPGRLAGAGVGVGHRPGHRAGHRLHAAARRRAAADPHRGGGQRRGADALRAEDAVLLRLVVPWVHKVDGSEDDGTPEGRTVAVAGPDSVWFDTDVPTYGEDLTTFADFTVSEGER